MNVPNRISIFRIILVPIVILGWLFPYSHFGIDIPTFYILNSSISLIKAIIFILYITAVVSDYISTKIISKKQHLSIFDQFINPICDKCLNTTIFILLTIDMPIITLPVIIIICRDIIIDGCRMIAAKEDIVIQPNVFGKVKKAVHILTIGLGLLSNLPFEYFGFPAFETCVWFSCLLSIVSGISYYRKITYIALKKK